MKSQQGLLLIVLLLAFIISCGDWPTGISNDPPPHIDSTYSGSIYITFITQDIFTDADIGGDVVINGQKKASGSRFSVEYEDPNYRGRIDSLYVEVPNYYGAYIVGTYSSGKVVLKRDADGVQPSYVNQTVLLKLIPQDFDTVGLAKTMGDGIIKNYNKHTINVGIMKKYRNGLKPTKQTIKNLKAAISMINEAANNVIVLDYIGRINSELQDGVTHKVYDGYGSHGQAYNGFVIRKSILLTRPHATLHLILEELTQAATGLVGDDPVRGFLYLSGNASSPTWINDGARAIQLANLLPVGFKLDTENVPSVDIQYSDEQIAFEMQDSNPSSQQSYTQGTKLRNKEKSNKIKK